MKRIVSAILLVILLTSMLYSAFKIVPVGAVGTIYIRADGSIDPPDAPISTVDNVTYFLTGSITSDADGIVIERNNIILDGASHTVQGTGASSIGAKLTGRSNVTIENITTKAFEWGIGLDSSSNNSISGNNITTNNVEGIWVFDSSNNNINGNNIANNGHGVEVYSVSSNNSISGNNITANNLGGIVLTVFCPNNTVSGNSITNNGQGEGVAIFFSDFNTISGNNITNNGYGIWLDRSSNNKILHNNFANNNIQAYSSDSVNVWDDGYPSGGNYWSDYSGFDFCSGSYQNETGSDGIGDSPYVADAYNRDNYPLMKPYPWDSHDIGVTYIGNVWEIYFPPIIPLKTVVGLGFRLYINVFVMNYGAYSEVFNVTVYANTTAIDTITNITLASRNSVILNFTWYTSGFAKGNYTISAYASPVPDETDTADNTLIDGWVFVAMPGDVNGDGIVNIIDIVRVALAFGAVPANPNWDPNADINGDKVINIVDIVIVALHFGETG